jgi:hypothetical protein
MPYYGQFTKGVIVLNDPVKLPEGTLVKVEPVASPGQEKNQPPREWKGIFRNTGPVPTEEDIRQMRDEAWHE